MSNFDKSIQLEIMNTLKIFYPNSIDAEAYNTLIKKYTHDVLLTNTEYLVSLGLMHHNAIMRSLSGSRVSPAFFQITGEGMTFISENSIGSDLQVQTIKIHQDTIDNLETLIKFSGLPEKEKETLLTKLKEHGAKELLSKGIDYTMANGPAITAMLATWARSKGYFQD